MKKKISFSLFLLLTAIHVVYSQPQFSTNANCKIWEEFVKAQNTGKPTTLLDFSYAGYRHSETDIPQVVYKTFNVCDYGAIPNDHISDRDAVIKAIEAAQRNGSGIIYFPKGRFHLHKKGEPDSPIFIKGGNIVFRGEGTGINGTELFMEFPNTPVNPNEKWTSSSLFCFTGGGYAETLTKVTSNAARGSLTIEVENSTKLKAGDWVRLRLRNNTPSIVDKELSPYKVQEEWRNLFINGVVVDDYHQIIAVKGRKVTFKEPIMHPVEAVDNWTIMSFPHIKEVGIEQIAFIGNWKDKFIHHQDWLHDGGYKFIEYRNVVNSWIRACRFTDVSEAATINSSANVSIIDCVVTGTLGHNSFHSQGSSRVFMGAIDDQPSQWHSVGVAKTTLGTVIWRVKTRPNSCFESHASQPRATLFDACEGGFMEGRSGGAMSNMPNHLRDLVLWNYKELDAETKDFSFWPTDNRWYKVMPPIIVGFHGAGTTFLQSQVAYEESNGQPVAPESLFEAQLLRRLGKLPQWIVELKERMSSNSLSGELKPSDTISVANVEELRKAVSNLQPGGTILLKDGEYKDVQLQIKASGSTTSATTIKADNRGKVVFSGDTKVELLGNHITFDGVCFKNGLRNPQSWENNSAGLLTIYGNYCRVTECQFLSFDHVNSAYIATATYKDRNAPQYARIDHCTFIGKDTSSEMICLDNSSQPMYHQIEFCHFSNPKETNNVAGGIKINSKGEASGRCTIANNMFERFDSDIITSKSKENIFYNNTFMNCRGTFYLQDGERQVVLNNFFIGTDTLHEYGGMEVGGNGHLIGCNYFNLPRTLTEKGNVAIRFKEGASHIAMIKNVFIDVAHCSFGFILSPDIETKAINHTPHDIHFVGNLFFAENSPQSIITTIPELVAKKQLWKHNLYNGVQLGIKYKIDGVEKSNASLRYDDSKTYIEDFENIAEAEVEKYTPIQSIEGIEINIPEILKFGCSGSPL